jgi:hypothetical protein
MPGLDLFNKIHVIMIEIGSLLLTTLLLSRLCLAEIRKLSAFARGRDRRRKRLLARRVLNGGGKFGRP